MNILPYLVLCVSLTFGTYLNPTGWLDRLVQYHKQKFIDNVQELAPITIKATIVPSPPGYADSADWTFESVMRLISLMRKSEQAKPAVKVLRRMLGPSRRFMSRGASFKHFPSLFKEANNDVYYDISSGEMYMEDEYDASNSTGLLSDNAVIFISNPVESRLPSSKISVGLLREILEKRAEAARQMPTTKKWVVKTDPKKKTKPTSAATSAVSNDTTADAESDATTVGDGASNDTAAEVTEVTTEAATEGAPAA